MPIAIVGLGVFILLLLIMKAKLNTFVALIVTSIAIARADCLDDSGGTTHLPRLSNGCSVDDSGNGGSDAA